MKHYLVMSVKVRDFLQMPTEKIFTRLEEFKFKRDQPIETASWKVGKYHRVFFRQETEGGGDAYPESHSIFNKGEWEGFKPEPDAEERKREDEPPQPEPSNESPPGSDAMKKILEDAAKNIRDGMKGGGQQQRRRGPGGNDSETDKNPDPSIRQKRLSYHDIMHMRGNSEIYGHLYLHGFIPGEPIEETRCADGSIIFRQRI